MQNILLKFLNLKKQPISSNELMNQLKILRLKEKLLKVNLKFMIIRNSHILMKEGSSIVLLTKQETIKSLHQILKLSKMKKIWKWLSMFIGTKR
jgi:hypothetical protein